MDYVKVKSIEHLKEILDMSEEGEEFVIALCGGLNSSKRMSWDGKKFWILNYIDDTEQELTPKQLMGSKHSNIAEAITKGAFWHEV